MSWKITWDMVVLYVHRFLCHLKTSIFIVFCAICSDFLYLVALWVFPVHVLSHWWCFVFCLFPCIFLSCSMLHFLNHCIKGTYVVFLCRPSTKFPVFTFKTTSTLNLASREKENWSNSDFSVSTKYWYYWFSVSFYHYTMVVMQVFYVNQT